jgi:hypothetical protein
LYLSSTHTGEINEKGLWLRMVGDRANILENQMRLLALSYMYNVSDMPTIYQYFMLCKLLQK